MLVTQETRQGGLRGRCDSQLRGRPLSRNLVGFETWRGKVSTLNAENVCLELSPEAPVARQASKLQNQHRPRLIA